MGQALGANALIAVVGHITGRRAHDLPIAHVNIQEAALLTVRTAHAGKHDLFGVVGAFHSAAMGRAASERGATSRSSYGPHGRACCLQEISASETRMRRFASGHILLL